MRSPTKCDPGNIYNTIQVQYYFSLASVIDVLFFQIGFSVGYENDSKWWKFRNSLQPIENRPKKNKEIGNLPRLQWQYIRIKDKTFELKFETIKPTLDTIGGLLYSRQIPTIYCTLIVSLFMNCKDHSQGILIKNKA